MRYKVGTEQLQQVPTLVDRPDTAFRASACAAVRADPLRESARASLIQVHLAEGNLSEAVREFARYQAVLHIDLGLEPTSRLRHLIDGLHSP